MGGELLEAAEQDVQGCEAITRLAVELWDKAYHEVSAELGEKDLARAIVDSMKSHNDSTCSDEASRDKEKSDEAHGVSSRPDAGSPTSAWKSESGWWMENPLAGRAVVTCGMLPQPHACFTFKATTIYSAGGEGLHMVAVDADSAVAHVAPQSFACCSNCADAVACVAGVPEGAVIMVALLGDANTAEFLSALV